MFVMEQRVPPKRRLLYGCTIVLCFGSGINEAATDLMTAWIWLDCIWTPVSGSIAT